MVLRSVYLQGIYGSGVYLNLGLFLINWRGEYKKENVLLSP